MTIRIRPDAVRAGWRHAERAAEELRGARCDVLDAGGRGLVDLAGAVGLAAGVVDRALDRVLTALTDHGERLEACLTDLEGADEQAAGGFRGMAR